MSDNPVDLKFTRPKGLMQCEYACQLFGHPVQMPGGLVLDWNSKLILVAFTTDQIELFENSIGYEYLSPYNSVEINYYHH